MNRTLMVALHGVGASARILADALGPLSPLAEIVALDGPEPFDGGGIGRQWFSVAQVTDANRAERIAAALPPLLDRLDRLARERGLAREDIVLLGFSQGAILTLAMVAQGLHPGRAVAIAGRLAVPPIRVRGRGSELLLISDRIDPVMPAALTVAAAARLAKAGHHIEHVQTDGVGHAIAPATLDVVAGWLAATSPDRTAFDTVKGQSS